jgi:hypothetical protein
MKFTTKTLLISLSLFISFNTHISAGESKPVSHIKLENITSSEAARSVFQKDTAELKAKSPLNNEALPNVHFITYSLEKSIAYYAEKGGDDVQVLAKEIADVVEAIHLHSENGRLEETQNNLQNYFILAETLEAKLGSIH